jgi:uncharacterized protein with HEPN domain
LSGTNFSPTRLLNAHSSAASRLSAKQRKHVPDEFRAEHSQFEWRAMAGMRDRLIHGYFGVDYELVWDVVANKIPTLRDQLASLLEELDRP